ncbi:hypothetical protein Hanom_Chr16g01431981 [Helianthus anomalus]
MCDNFGQNEKKRTNFVMLYVYVGERERVYVCMRERERERELKILEELTNMLEVHWLPFKVSPTTFLYVGGKCTVLTTARSNLTLGVAT